MSEDYLAQAQPTQTWNTARGVWEKQGIANLLCEHWELFSETWQTSGTMRNGKVYALPTQALPITDSEFSSLPTLRTPAASEAERGHQPEDKSKARGGQVTLSGQMMTYFPTPNTMDHLPARTPEAKALNKGKGGYANVRETVVNDLMPTPIVRDYKDGSAAQMRDGKTSVDTVASAIFNSGEVLLPTTQAQNGEDRNNKIWARDLSKPQNLENALAVTLLPTTRTSMANGPTQKEIALGNPKTRIETEVMLGETSWGKFEPAIRRWEKTLGRPAPLPTNPDGKDGAHRLSSAFTEWMMGLPEGWVTGVGITRNEELKACGNGVVPQQAELALRILLEGVTLPAGGGQVNLPTPTVSDTYTDNLKSTQQKEGSMHSVTLPQAVRVLSDKIEVGQRREPLTYETDNQSIGRDKSTAEDRQ